MIVVTEHRAGEEFLEPARILLEVLSATPGFVNGQIARSPDAPDTWLLMTLWRDVGSMRRGFGTFDAKVAAAPVMVSAVDRVSAFETRVEATPGTLTTHDSDLA